MERRQTTSAGEWTVLALIIIASVIMTLVVFYVLRPRLFSASSAEAPTSIIQGKGCPTSEGSSGIVVSQSDATKPSIDISWDPVLMTTVPNETIIGYYVYYSVRPIVSKSASKVYAAVPFAKLSAGILASTKYYIRISTVDTCGEGPLSVDEATFTTI